MELVVQTDGSLLCLYDETLDLSPLGQVTIRRASQVEPTDQGQWQADLSPVDGPVLGPFVLRSEALTAEVDWLRRYWLLTADAPA
jgi:hypothetical protein